MAISSWFAQAKTRRPAPEILAGTEVASFVCQPGIESDNAFKVTGDPDNPIAASVQTCREAPARISAQYTIWTQVLVDDMAHRLYLLSLDGQVAVLDMKRQGGVTLGVAHTTHKMLAACAQLSQLFIVTRRGNAVRVRFSRHGGEGPRSFPVTEFTPFSSGTKFAMWSMGMAVKRDGSLAYNVLQTTGDIFEFSPQHLSIRGRTVASLPAEFMASITEMDKGSRLALSLDEQTLFAATHTVLAVDLTRGLARTLQRQNKLAFTYAIGGGRSSSIDDIVVGQDGSLVLKSRFQAEVYAPDATGADQMLVGVPATPPAIASVPGSIPMDNAIMDLVPQANGGLLMLFSAANYVHTGASKHPVPTHKIDQSALVAFPSVFNAIGNARTNPTIHARLPDELRVVVRTLVILWSGTSRRLQARLGPGGSGPHIRGVELARLVALFGWIQAAVDRTIRSNAVLARHFGSIG